MSVQASVSFELHPIDRTAAEKLVSGLGATPDEVATSLRTAGAVGRRRSCSCCPLARYLHRMVPHPSGWMVAPTEASAWHDVTLVLPEAVVEFVRRFDGGEYTELVES